MERRMEEEEGMEGERRRWRETVGCAGLDTTTGCYAENGWMEWKAGPR
jgi:hypothetical protein